MSLAKRVPNTRHPDDRWPKQAGLTNLDRRRTIIYTQTKSPKCGEHLRSGDAHSSAVRSYRVLTTRYAEDTVQTSVRIS